MTPPRLTTSARVALIRIAIGRIKVAREHYRQVSADATMGTPEIEAAKALFTAIVREFGWQSENVEAVLDALAPEGK